MLITGPNSYILLITYVCIQEFNLIGFYRDISHIAQITIQVPAGHVFVDAASLELNALPQFIFELENARLLSSRSLCGISRCFLETTRRAVWMHVRGGCMAVKVPN